jgi:serine/threonine protein kinase
MSGIRPGSTIIDGKYRIEKRLGAGGMGAVYLATHLGTSRPVALKLIVPQLARDASFVERFKREARAAGRLRHPNIVDVTDFGIATLDRQQVAYLVMEYLDGCSLEDVLAEEPKLPLRWTVDFFEQFAVAVDEAHRKGIVHRDLKPSNVWLEPSLRGGYTAKVLDFGLAKLAEADTSDLAAPAEPVPPHDDAAPTLTAPGAARHVSSEAPTLALAGVAAVAPSPSPEPSPPDEESDAMPAETVEGSTSGGLTAVGAVMGTPRYMSPEQCRGDVAGPASDVYSMGVILYEMLSGAPPFGDSDTGTLMRKHMDETPVPLAEVAADVPDRVSALVMSALEKDPAKRPASARLFAEQLRAMADTPGALLQRGLVTCFEHFRTFIQIALLVVAPQAALVALVIFVNQLLRVGAIRPATHLAVGMTLWIAEIFVAVLASLMARGVAVLVIAQVLLAPLREVRLKLAYKALLRYFWPSLLGATTILAHVIVPIVAGYLAISWSREAVGGAMIEYLIRFEDPLGAAKAVGAMLAGFGFWYLALRQWAALLQLPNVILVESLSGRRAVERSRELANRSRRETLTIAFVTLAAPGLTMLVFGALRADASGVAAELILTAAMLGVLLLNAAIMPALVGVLYLKLRQACAEPIDQLLEAQFVTEDAPKTTWQRRLDISPYKSGLNRASAPDVSK